MKNISPSQNTIQLSAGKVAYSIYGESGPAIVLVHGGGTDSGWLSWRELIPVLAASYQVYVPDLPGYGNSTLAAGKGTTQDFIQTLGDLLDHWGLTNAILAGISMGGAISLGYTLTNPNRITRLILVDSYGLQNKAPAHKLSFLAVRIPYLITLSWAWFRSSRWMTKWALRSIIHDPAKVTAALVEEVYEVIQNPDSGRAFYVWQQDEVQWNGLRTCYMDRLRELNVKTILIHGEKDSLVPLKYAQEAGKRIPDSKLAVIPGCGHWPQREQPEFFNQHFVNFLKSEQ